MKDHDHRPEIIVEKDYGDLPEVECLGGQINRQVMVEKHQGTLAVNSQLGMGSEFLITIPLKSS